MKRFSLGISFGIACLFVGIVFIAMQIQRQGGSGWSSRVNTPTPTPMPFVELTIPYLRNRTYTSQLGEREKIADYQTYTSYRTSYDSDGLKIYGFLTIPNTDTVKKHPAIIFVHGYIPPSLYKTSERYGEYVDYLARNGFVVFKIDLRGHDESEGESRGAYYSSDYVIDTLNARASLAASDFVDPNAIGLWGHSMAGNVVMRAFAARPEIPAVVIWAGAGYTYTDLLTYRISDLSYRPPQSTTLSSPQSFRQKLREIYGEFDPQHPFWRQIPVTEYVKDLRGALEVHHAVDDTVVSIEYSRNLMKLLDQTTMVHQLFEYPTGGHDIDGSSFSSAMQRTVSFFQKYLKKE